MGNNEIIEFFMNDDISEKYVNVQTETSRNPKTKKKKQMKINF